MTTSSEPGGTSWSDLREVAPREVDSATRPGAPATATAKAKAIVFVHGIFSDHDTFEPMARRLSRDVDATKEWSLYWFDYDYHVKIRTSGAKLAELISTRFLAEDEVVLVGHSMGGLVCRMAVMSRHLRCVKRLIMLGSPNSGALRTGQLALLSAVMAGVVRQVCGVFSRKLAVLDLTKAARVFREEIKRPGAIENAAHVEYVTVPGLYFNMDRGVGVDAGLFAGLEGVSLFVKGVAPLLAFSLERPHDGIVEERSVSLCSRGGITPMSEKAWVVGARRCTPPTYCHVVADVAQDLTHTTLHQHWVIARIVADAVCCGRLDSWAATAGPKWFFTEEF